MTDDATFDRKLSLGWQALSPPDELKERVHARLSKPASSLPRNDAAGKTAALGAAPSRWRALHASGRVGASAGALLVGLGFIAGYWVASDAQRERQKEASAHSANQAGRAVSATPNPPIPVREVPSSAPERAIPPNPSRPRPAPPVHSDHTASHAGAASAQGTASELALLARAERAVRARQPELALALCGELRENFPSSSLHEERRAIALMARCQVGGAAPAAEREQFARQYPGSVYASRIDHECAAPNPRTDLTNRGAPDMNGGKGAQHVQEPSP